MNYTCIQINEIDLINDFYLVDKDSLNVNFEDYYYQSKFITIFGLMENKQPFLTNGLIINIKDGNFMYICNKPIKFLRGVIIINHQKDCIIGIDTEIYNTLYINKQNSIINIGIYMKNIIDDINNNFSSLISKKPFKINLGGDTNSGKTTFLDRIIFKSYKEGNLTTLSSTFFEIHKKVNNKLITFDVWDSVRWAGSFDSLVKNLLKGSKGILLLFALNVKNSFLSLDRCIDIINETDIDL